jgi:hypothetical protein
MLQTLDRGMLMGQPVWHKVPLAKIVCHACGQKGHYKGSRECPKTPSSAHMHAMGTDTNVEDQTSTENMETSDDILNGAEYVREDDFGPAEADLELKDFGTGAIIASIHVDEESDDDEVIYMATMATPTNSKPDDIKVTAELMKSRLQSMGEWTQIMTRRQDKPATQDQLHQGVGLKFKCQTYKVWK